MVREKDKPLQLCVAQPEYSVYISRGQWDLQPHAHGVREQAGEDDVEPCRHVAPVVRHQGRVVPDEAEPCVPRHRGMT